MNGFAKVAQLAFTAAWLGSGAAAVRALALGHQDTSGFTTGRMSEVEFRVPVRAGAVVLPPGKYQVMHVLEGEDVVSANEHEVIFRKLGMRAAKRRDRLADNSLVRLKCDLKMVANKAHDTSVTLRTTAAGEKEIVELQIAGEAFKHRLRSRSEEEGREGKTFLNHNK
jgi:hypothetical protein